MLFNKGMKRFKAKRIAITGAASGLGRALALRFAKEGWSVIGLFDTCLLIISQSSSELD